MATPLNMMDKTPEMMRMTPHATDCRFLYKSHTCESTVKATGWPAAVYSTAVPGCCRCWCSGWYIFSCINIIRLADHRNTYQHAHICFIWQTILIRCNIYTIIFKFNMIKSRGKVRLNVRPFSPMMPMPLLLALLRAYSVASPSVWNALPESLRDPELTLDIFRRQLKTYFFTLY